MKEWHKTIALLAIIIAALTIMIWLQHQNSHVLIGR